MSRLLHLLEPGKEALQERCVITRLEHLLALASRPVFRLSLDQVGETARSRFTLRVAQHGHSGERREPRAEKVRSGQSAGDDDALEPLPVVLDLIEIDADKEQDALENCHEALILF